MYIQRERVMFVQFGRFWCFVNGVNGEYRIGNAVAMTHMKGGKGVSCRLQ